MMVRAVSNGQAFITPRRLPAAAVARPSLVSAPQPALQFAQRQPQKNSLSFWRLPVFLLAAAFSTMMPKPADAVERRYYPDHIEAWLEGPVQREKMCDAAMQCADAGGFLNGPLPQGVEYSQPGRDSYRCRAKKDLLDLPTGIRDRKEVWLYGNPLPEGQKIVVQNNDVTGGCSTAVR